MMQNSVAFDRLSATGFCTAHVIDLVTAIFCRTDVRLRNTPCLGRFERYRLTGPTASRARRRGMATGLPVTGAAVKNVGARLKCHRLRKVKMTFGGSGGLTRL